MGARGGRATVTEAQLLYAPGVEGRPLNREAPVSAAPGLLLFPSPPRERPNELDSTGGVAN
jgi:hypothetical protein